MAELTPPGFDNMVGSLSLHPPKQKTTSRALSCSHLLTCTVFWPLRPLESRVVDDRAERDTSDHRPHGRQLAGVPVPIRALRRGEHRHLVWR